jgi:hypothetical protein
MGVDPALGSDFPSVVIDGEKFYFGQEPVYGQFMASHPCEGKNYWCFQTEQQMLDFLENLPESSRPPTINGYAIWYLHGMMPQREYDRIFAEHRRYLRLLLETRRQNGLTFPFRE